MATETSQRDCANPVCTKQAEAGSRYCVGCEEMREQEFMEHEEIDA